MTGTLDAPTGKSKVVPIAAAKAQRLAYYESGQGFGILAPRGWYCYGSGGSAGDSLYLSPQPISMRTDMSSIRAGPAIIITESIGGTSGRYGVVKTVARVFPAHWDFARGVMKNKKYNVPASDITFGPYPTDKLTYQSSEIVEYQTPANTDGLGTDSGLEKNGYPISGLAIFEEVPPPDDPDVLLVGVRLPPALAGLAPAIIQQLEHDHAINAAASFVQGQPPQISTIIPHGNVTHHFYKTAIARNLPNNEEDYYVYTPPGYNPKSSTKYPVLYLLHGWDEQSSGWVKLGQANIILDNLIAQGKARPMIVVMPHGYGNYRFFTGGKPGWLLPNMISENVVLFSQMLRTEIIPQVESTYKVSKKGEDRAIAGLSMGGLEALLIGLENPRMFSWIGGFSSAVQTLGPARLPNFPPEAQDLRLVWIACGESDMREIVDGNKRLIAELGKQGLTVTAIHTTGKHEWTVWQYNLNQFAPLLFQSK